MITFETQEDFEEAVKAVIRGSLSVDADAISYWNGYKYYNCTRLTLKLDSEVVSEADLG